MKNIPITEADHQKAVIRWAEDMLKFQPKKYWMLAFLFAVPNEGQHKPQYRKHQKAMGLKAGVPDLCLPYPTFKTYITSWNVEEKHLVAHGLFIEMKSKDTKGRLTENQKNWIAHLKFVGYKVEVCWSAQEAIKALEDYINEGS